MKDGYLYTVNWTCVSRLMVRSSETIVFDTFLVVYSVTWYNFEKCNVENSTIQKIGSLY